MKKAVLAIVIIIILAGAGFAVWWFAAGPGHNNTNTKSTTASSSHNTNQNQNNNRKLTAAKAQIKSNWEKFFNPSTTAQQRVDLLQNGSQFASTIQAEVSSPTAKATSVTVSNVALSSPTAATANVTYTINVNGQPALSNQQGQAVYVGNTWKVGDGAFCTLMQLSGSAPAACTNPSTQQSGGSTQTTTPPASTTPAPSATPTPSQ